MPRGALGLSDRSTTMNMHADWSIEAGAPASSLDEGRRLAGALHGFRPQQKPADRWPSIAIAVAGHLLIAWAVVHATMTVITPPKPEQTITVSIDQAKATPTPPAPQPPQLQPLTKLVQSVPPPDVNAPTIQVAVAPTPAEMSPPAPPVAPAPPVQKAAPIEQALTPPRFDVAYLKNPGPVYPNMSRRLREIGTVQLRVRVSADGQPLEITLANSSGYPRLDDSAKEAVKKWRFQPAMRGDTAVEAWVLVPVEFSLTHT